MPSATTEPPVRHALVLPYSTSSVSEARRLVRKDLTARGLPASLVEDGLSVLSELVANAVLHARPLQSGGIRLVWSARPDQIDLEVTDGGGEEEPRLVECSPIATGGRGLAIVSSLAQEWGVLPGDDSVTVYARIVA